MVLKISTPNSVELKKSNGWLMIRKTMKILSG